MRGAANSRRPVLGSSAPHASRYSSEQAIARPAREATLLGLFPYGNTPGQLAILPITRTLRSAP